MIKNIKKWLLIFIFSTVCAILTYPLIANHTLAAPAAPTYDKFAKSLIDDGSVIDPGNVGNDNTLFENVKALFYPWWDWTYWWNRIYNVIRDLTLWIMIVFIVWMGATMLFKRKDRKMDDLVHSLWNLLYMIIWCCFVYWAWWLFGDVLNFSWNEIVEGWSWISEAASSLVGPWWAFFQILAVIKWFAFFLAIIMIVMTGIRVIAAGEQDKWKKLVKWLINVVVALIVIKWIDFIYYMAMDAETFVTEASEFIINAAKLFAYLYWAVIVIMVFIAGYFYLTDWWSWNGFKKACNILVNIVLSWLVLFSFLLILYQIFAEFWPGWDAVTTS